MALPSVHDTHCEGPGLSSTTRTWSSLYKLWKKWDSFGRGVPDNRDAPTILPPHLDLTGKNVLISGANSGIGYEATYIFALWGARVTMACRPETPPHELKPEEARQALMDRSKGQIKPEQLEVWDVNMADMDSVHALGKRWIQTGRTLDILANNAGIVTPKFVITEDGFELSRAVNYLGHCLLTLTVLPSMKSAQTPRIVNTCSCFHYQGTLDFSNMDYERCEGELRGPGGVQAYCDTKLQHMMWTRELQTRLSNSEEYRHIIVNGLHPGFVGTGIWTQPAMDKSKQSHRMAKMLKYGLEHVSVTPEHGCLCILYGALHSDFGLPPSQVQALGGDSPNVSLPKGLSAKRGGNYVSRWWLEEPRPECKDRLACGRLWQRTLEDIKAGQRGVLPAVPGHPQEIC